jgi:hypothetical protein
VSFTLFDSIMMQGESDYCIFSIHPIKSYLASQFENELNRSLHLSVDRGELLLVSFQRIFCVTSLDQTSPVASMYLDQNTRTDLHQDEAENGNNQQSNKDAAPEYFARYLNPNKSTRLISKAV